ncbi:RlpA-like double-psi beta-barrel-protein domain-containing protein-containing protein [Aspergillus varians]
MKYQSLTSIALAALSASTSVSAVPLKSGANGSCPPGYSPSVYYVTVTATPTPTIEPTSSTPLASSTSVDALTTVGDLETIPAAVIKESTTTESTIIESTSTESATVEPTTIESTTTESATTEPASTESAAPSSSTTLSTVETEPTQVEVAQPTTTAETTTTTTTTTAEAEPSTTEATTTTTEEAAKSTASSSTSSSTGATVSGKATFYGGNVSGGACSFSGYTIPSHLFGVAFSGQAWDSSAECGACVSVTGPNGNSIKAMIVDECPECAPSHLDLFESAFSELAATSVGIIPISYEFIPCSISSPLILKNKEGTSAYWFSMQVVNANEAVASLEVSTDGGSTWQETTRSDYNFFENSSGFGTDSVDVRVKGISGGSVVVKSVGVSSGTSVTATENI